MIIPRPLLCTGSPFTPGLIPFAVLVILSLTVDSFPSVLTLAHLEKFTWRSARSLDVTRLRSYRTSAVKKRTG